MVNIWLSSCNAP